jgi:hypothetical protein
MLERVGSFQRYLLGQRLYRKYRSATMIPKSDYVANVSLVANFLRRPHLSHGAIIECGTWRGGMAAALIEIGGPHREYHFFDSFEGLPAPTERDGQQAIDWQRNAGSPVATYFDNCTATLGDFERTIALARLPDRSRLHIHKGFFDSTLPTFVSPNIAVLRLDGDWYDSTMICLRKFWNHVLPGGIIIIDDYFAWDGCTRAVYDFLSSIRANERIRHTRRGQVGFIEKRGAAQERPRPGAGRGLKELSHEV